MLDVLQFPLFATEKEALPRAPEIVLHRSRRRTVSIHVYDNRVEIRAPLRAAKGDIDAFVNQKKNWIALKLAEIAQRAKEGLSLQEGHVITVAGEVLTIRRQEGARGKAFRHDGLLVIEGRSLDEGKVESLFRLWLAKEAEAYLVPRATTMAASLGVAGRLHGFTLRYTRSLWGRCSASGNILFNPYILLASTRVIDYLMAHEICHLRHMNHSREFWQLVSSMCPDWQDSRIWLREHGHRLRVK